MTHRAVLWFALGVMVGQLATVLWWAVEQGADIAFVAHRLG